MTVEVGGPSAGRDPQVWLLGNTHPFADRSIGWHDRLPNLGDPDSLVIDMTTLTMGTIRQIGSLKLDQVKKYVRDKLFGGGGTIVVVTAAEFSAPPIDTGTARPISPLGSPFGSPFADQHEHSNYRVLPTILETVQTEKGRNILPDAGHDFGAYLCAVGHFTFYIAGCGEMFHTGPHNRQFALERVDGQNIRDNSGHDLGFTLDAIEVERGTRAGRTENTGRLVFLPPYTEPTVGAIEKILSACGKAPPRGEVPPPWAEGLSFAKVDCLQAQIAELETDASKIQDQIAKLDRQRDEILAHRRLLYAKSADLESAVASALRAIGFAEARQMGKSDQADCVIDINTGGYLYGLVEVKGADGRTGERHISQCVKWVDKAHEVDGKPSKGIFVPNQHRSAEYPGSTKDRLWFESNELEYAKMRDVCIIPSCALFEAAKKALDGEAPDRAEIVARIAGTKGVLERVF